ncbi:MAG TPA: tyrosine-type recombinase/integrase [Solirubrobacterales bacterium]|nr:tyrosine-type recombinase/integrase [Solirubrobacterales bacterium]
MLARVRAGVWERPAPPPTLARQALADDAPLYTDYTDWWLQAKIDGLIGDGPIADNTAADYEWRLGYSRQFFADTPVDVIDRHLALAFKAHLLAEAREQREMLEAGADLRDLRGRTVVPLSLASIKKILDAFASVLDEAIEDEHREDNPARTKRMQIKVPKPKRTYLEMDELAALLDAARDQDIALPDFAAASVAKGTTAEKVLRSAAVGNRPKQIATELGLAKSTVTYHLRRHDVQVGRGYIGRRVICELLGRAGLRVSELCDLKIGAVRLHDSEGAHLRILDAKTEAGERVVLVSPDLAEVVIEHIDRLRRAGMPTGPDDYLIPNTSGGRISRQRVAKIVAAAAKLAGERLRAKGLAPLPHTTPHTLRRTYISIALVANNFDVKWVMDQVGHSDSTMTMDVYAQLQQRMEREHGKNFDRLVRKAKKQLAGIVSPVRHRRLGDDWATKVPQLGQA